MKNLTDHIIEIRYQANPLVIDQRGLWASIISKEMQLPYWSIEENRVIVKDNEEKEVVYAGFKNAGFIVRDQPTENYFKDKVNKYIKVLYSLPDFCNTLIVTRIGLRIRTCVEYKGSFDELKDKFINKYFYLSKEAQELINAELADIGGNLNFKDKLGNFNTTCGPMLLQQISEFFKGRSTYPDVGLYYDIDYYIEPNGSISKSDMQKILRNFYNSAANKTQKIIHHILN